MEQKKRVLNLRLCVTMLMGVFAGILSFTFFLYFIYLKRFRVVSFFFFLLTLANLVGFFVVIFYKKKDLKKYLKHVITFLCCFAIAISSFIVKFNIIGNYATFSGKQTVVGTVCGYGYSNNYYRIILTNATVGDTKLKSKISVSIYLDSEIPSNISLGDFIEFEGKVNKTELVSNNNINFSTYSYGQVYKSSTSMSKIKLTDKKANFIYAFQDRVRHLLDDNMNEENSAFAYSIFLGDKTRVASDIKQAFSYAGISHIIAVSGLHVTFLTAIIYFVIGLFKGGRKTKFFVTTPILFIYCMLCGFTSSVLRASFMSIIFMLADVLGLQYDSISSLSLAGVLILLVFPLNLFNLGFQLSFMCVFTIITLANRMTRVLVNRLKFPKWLASSFSISLCVTLGTLPLCANVLGEVSIISVLSNLIVIPLFSVTYPILVVAILFGMIWTKLGVLLSIPELFLHAIKIIANFFAGINLAHFKLFNLGYLIVLMFVLLCFLCRFLMVNVKTKFLIVLALAIGCVTALGVGAQPSKFTTTQMITNYQYDTVSVVFTTTDNKKILVGFDDYSTDKLLFDAKISRLDAWVLTDINNNNMDFYVEFIKEYKVKQLFLPRYNALNSFDIVNLSKITNISNVNKVEISDFKAFFIANEDLCAGLKVEINDKSLLIVPNTTVAKLTLVTNSVSETVDYLIINSSEHDIPWRFKIDYEKLIYHNDISFSPKKDSICMENKDYFVVKL